MQGKMKIRGNMAAATKFTPDLFPPPTPENIAKYAKLWTVLYKSRNNQIDKRLNLRFV